MAVHVSRSTQARRRVRGSVGIAAAAVVLAVSGATGVATAQAAQAAGTPAAAARASAAKTAPVPSNGEIFSWIKDLTSHGYRRTGTPAGRRAAEYMVRKFKAFGLQDAHVETVRSYAWEAKRWGLKVGGTPIDAFPVAHSFRGARSTATGSFSTGAKGRTAPLVDVGSGTASDMAKVDVRGKIVVFDMRFLALPLSIFQVASEFYWDPDLTMKPTDVLDQPYLSNYADFANRAVAAGAVGFVGVLADYFGSNKYFNEDYRRAQVTIPGMWITRDKGVAVRAAMKAGGGSVPATITLEGRRRAVTGRTAIGYLPGRSTETVLVQSHHDSVWDGAVEDGSGAAEVLALAKHFGSQPKASRERTLMFTTFDTHFTGYQAHHQFRDRYILKHPGGRRLVANVTLEHIAKRATVVGNKLAVSNMPEPRGVLQNTGPKVRAMLKQAIIDNDLRRMAILPAAIFGGSGIPTDASFNYYSGVPVLSLISGPMYLYDRADTLDKVVKTDLHPMAQAFATVIAGLDDIPTGEIGDGVPIKQETRR